MPRKVKAVGQRFAARSSLRQWAPGRERRASPWRRYRRYARHDARTAQLNDGCSFGDRRQRASRPQKSPAASSACSCTTPMRWPRRPACPLAEAITFHTNFHRLFAYGNLAKMPPDPEFVSLVGEVIAIDDRTARLDRLDRCLRRAPARSVAARPFSLRPALRLRGAERGRRRPHPFPQPRQQVTVSARSTPRTSASAAPTSPQMFAFVARRWPEAKAVNGASWLYNTEGYRRLFPQEFANSRTPLIGPRPIHGLSTWGQFLDFRGHVKPPSSRPSSRT